MSDREWITVEQSQISSFLARWLDDCNGKTAETRWTQHYKIILSVIISCYCCCCGACVSCCDYPSVEAGAGAGAGASTFGAHFAVFELELVYDNTPFFFFLNLPRHLLVRFFWDSEYVWIHGTHILSTICLDDVIAINIQILIRVYCNENDTWNEMNTTM